ncbi:class F sortase [Microbispora sp. NPDC049125]|uniref:class F sortase n=1 Tax=Microbispora sp. NPDC049125 TaxID=3154929 RepID=UPI003466573B
MSSTPGPGGTPENGMPDGTPANGMPDGIPATAGTPSGAGGSASGATLASGSTPASGSTAASAVSPAGAQRKRRPMPQPVLATLLIGGSFGGIVAIMVGMLAVLSPPASDPQEPLPGQVNVQNADRMAAYLPPTVGPGGPGVPLTAAAPTAPPPDPVLQPFPPLALTTTTASSSSSPLSSSSKAPKAPAKVPGRPVKIRIPAIGVYASVGQVGVEKSGEIQAPPLSRPSLTGWYRLGPAPGDQGPAIILGHVNTKKGSAVFSRLRELKRGNKIAVLRADGKTAIFTVDGIEQVGKSTFPTKRVYGNTVTASLRLITCGGVFNAKRHSYTDNIVVYATLTSTKGK